MAGGESSGTGACSKDFVQKTPFKENDMVFSKTSFLQHINLNLIATIII